MDPSSPAQGPEGVGVLLVVVDEECVEGVCVDEEFVHEACVEVK